VKEGKDRTGSSIPSRQALELLSGEWHDAPRRWGHPLHSLCSYLAMFPPQMASFFIRWLTEPGDAVYDPFSGRGTVALEAVLQGRQGLGADANPLAHALTKAKVRIPAASAVSRRLADLEAEFISSVSQSLDSIPHDIRMLYSTVTLRQLQFLRQRLTGRGYVDPFITALILGMLHANHSGEGATRGFSISMPNTFAMAPGYVRKYIDDHGLEAPDVDVFGMLRARAAQYELPDEPLVGGRSWLGDAAKPSPIEVKVAKPKLVFTSPPYLQVIKYGKYNWVRLWFLGQDARQVDRRLMASSSPSRYLAFMKKVLEGIKSSLDTEGYVCLVIGDVRRGKEQLNLAEQVWEKVARPAGWQHHGTIADALPVGGKVTRIWKENQGRATKTDRLLLLSPWPGVSLPPLPAIDWDQTPELQNIANAGGSD
jgi:DNA methylase